MARFNFFLSCIFKYSSTSEDLSRWNYLYGGRDALTAWSKPRGDGSCPVSPTQEKLSSSHSVRWDLGFGVWQGRIPSQVFCSLVERNHTKISAPELHTFFIIRERTGMPGSAFHVGQSPATLAEQTSFIRERKGISVKQRLQLPHGKTLCHFLVGSAGQELKNLFPE